MIQLHWSLGALDPCHIADPRQRAAGGAQLQVGKTGGIGAEAFIAADQDRNALLPSATMPA